MGYRDEECKGCLGYGDHLCDMLPNCKSLKCPCLICLIKGMCQANCEAVRNYAKEAFNYDCIDKK